MECKEEEKKEGEISSNKTELRDCFQNIYGSNLTMREQREINQ